ncbi:MAG: HAD family hydrolase [Candidatus Eremiobacteraeota bacterium]|nr:HAD family hydrolase [Candidatus Eremiobacteraeota bacterium]MBC5827467.1 HAD family hydrolase [Candidatus Eremiobacteraeota bacterium]
MSSIQAVFFDLDDTLIDDTESLESCAQSAAAELAADLKIAPAALGAAYVEAAIGFWTALGPGSSGPPRGDIRPTMWREALARHGVRDDDLARRLAARFDALRLASVAYFPEVLPVLEELHRRYTLGIITNGFAETHDKKMARLELSKFFDHVLLAGEMDLAKPDPQIFRHAMDLAGSKPEQSVMVGDRFERDIRGAQRAGMRTVWFNIRKEALPERLPLADATIGSMAELPAALRRIELG